MPRLTNLVSCVLTLLALAALPLGARAQESDILRGRVFGPDSTPLPGVTITATGQRAQITKTARTDARGSFTIIFPDGGDEYVITAALIGFVAQRREVAKEEGQIAFPTTDFHMTRIAQQLSGVRVTAQRAKPDRSEFPNTDVGAGATQTFVSAGSAMSGDPTGSIAAALSTVPGLSVMSDGTGAPPTVSAFGLSADQNTVTMNGMSMGNGSLPRDMAFGQVAMNSYDPGHAGSGVSVNFFAPGGSNFMNRTVHVSLEAPSLQWADPAAARLGGVYTQGVASGQLSGAFKEDRSYYSVGWQVQRQSKDLATVTSANAASLHALGIGSDSLNRLLQVSNGFGIPVSTTAVPNGQLATSGSMLSRFDYSQSAATTFNVTVNAGLNRNEGTAGATASPATGSQSTGWNLQAQPRLSKYVWGSVLNETSMSYATSGNQGTPYLAMPNARVRLNSTLDDGTSGIATVSLGGNPSGDSRSSQWSGQMRNETSWYTIDSKHRIKLTLDGSVNHTTASQSSNRYGTFTFNSLEGFEAGRPATFSRTLTFPGTNSSYANWLVGVGDVYRRSQRLNFQYGLQFTGASVPTRPAFNPLVDALFARRTDRIPGTFTWSPMASFSWTVGNYGVPLLPGQRVPARGTFSGGISQRRGSVSASSIESVARQTGLPGDLRSLTCVGDAAPVPDWTAYRQSLGSIPAQCLDGSTGSVLVQTNPSVLLFDPAYNASESWRMNLGISGIISRMFRGSISGVYARNLKQSGSFDLNFNPLARFTLPDEGNRPVFVTPTSVSTTSGAVSSRESRLHDQFAQVNERRSDLTSDSRQIITSINYSPPLITPLSSSVTGGVTYVLSLQRDMSRGFGGTTAGDPRITTWGRSSGEQRHQITLNANLRAPDWGNLTLFTQFSSGRPYTPRVSGDINGDGSSNDRAFVFDPARASDSTLARDMTTLLAVPGRAADCLRAQLGRIAGRNSCVGPWTANLRMALSINPRKLGLSSRTQVSLWFNNALAALDRLFNGDEDLRGWGSFVTPDATLLNVRGFDPGTGRYLYQVNPRFGTTIASRSFRQPFSVVLDVRMSLSPPSENMMVRSMMKPRPADSTKMLSEAQIKARLFSPGRGSELQQLIQVKDGLKLTPVQVDSLTHMNQRILAKRDTLYTALAHYLASLPDRRVTGEAGKRYMETSRESQRALLQFVPAVKALLTTEQQKKLPPGITFWINSDPRQLDRIMTERFVVF
jgi:carboxypeptidase family protein/TonB-dependent receptor-like protein